MKRISYLISAAAYVLVNLGFAGSAFAVLSKQSIGKRSPSEELLKSSFQDTLNKKTSFDAQLIYPNFLDYPALGEKFIFLIREPIAKSDSEKIMEDYKFQAIFHGQIQQIKGNKIIITSDYIELSSPQEKELLLHKKLSWQVNSQTYLDLLNDFTENSSTLISQMGLASLVASNGYSAAAATSLGLAAALSSHYEHHSLALNNSQTFKIKKKENKK